MTLRGHTLLTALTLLAAACADRHSPRVCEEITIPMCVGIGYNMTYMPNQFNHDNQEEAGMEVHQFWPLVEIKCSPDLLFFLCSMYTPICVTNYDKPLPACRSVCERARNGCAPLMKQYGFSWPERMKCENLPEFGDRDQLCMDFNTSSSGSTTTPSKPVKPIEPQYTTHSYMDYQPSCKCSCNSPFVSLEEGSAYYNKVYTGEVKNCAMSCHGSYFPPEARKFVGIWVGAWSILCFISTLLTVITFLIDMGRFEYPERPIIFLSACYLMISIGYIIRLVAGHESVACNNDVIRYNATGPALCTIVFLLIYFFGMASSIWWVLLALTWFLAAGLKWGQEAISSYSQYYHLVAWLLPSIKTITILALSAVDGDSVTGICYVGNQSLMNLRIFVLAPLFVYLLIGTSFLLAGFVNLFRIRDAIRQQGQQKTENLEKLMIKIGVFSVLYTVPATVVIACHFYEQSSKHLWDNSINCECSSVFKPDYSVFMLKYFMCLIVGITSGFWIWSSKTITSWRKFCSRLCRRDVNNRSKHIGVSYTRAPPPPPPSTKSFTSSTRTSSHV